VSRRLLWAAVLGWGWAAAETPDECRALGRRGQLADARRCFTSLAFSPAPYHRAEGYWGLGWYQDANEQFKAAVAAAPKNAHYRVRWGRLFLDRSQPADAAKLFQEALAIDEKHAPALLGLALAASESFEEKAIEMARKALEADPKLVEARELLARLALEEGNQATAIEEADEALKLSGEALDAMAVRATVDWMNDRDGAGWMDRVLKRNPVYGEAYAIAGRLFVLNRRYEEGIRLYRKALELNPELWPARAELGINLMRLGEETEARRHLEQCYENGQRDNPTVNTLRLLDSYKNFQRLESPRTVLKLHKSEAELLKLYMEPELERALRTFEKKYQFRLDRPVQLEVYPDHEDFAVRTMGMPGLGALGVTFGYVVAMDSPSGRKPGHFHWASTLWHELSHVFVLTATRHRVPRWFTEGLAVHEETAVSPDWGDRMSPEVIRALKDKKLLPVAQLDRGFIRPSYPAQVVVSYYQAGKICDYINARWGFQKLLDMMHAFGARGTTPDVIEKHLGMKPEEFDKQFFAAIEKETAGTVHGYPEWSKRVRGLAELAREKNHDEVIREGLAIRDMYAEYVEAASVYEFLAEAYLEKDDKARAATELERYARIGGRSPATLKKLAGLQSDLGNKQAAAATLERLNYIYPVKDEELHRRLGDLRLDTGDQAGAVREYQAVLASKPLDPAASHYNLARALWSTRRAAEAEEQVLLALEAAPGFRPAQKLLLEMNSLKK